MLPTDPSENKPKKERRFWKFLRDLAVDIISSVIAKKLTRKK